jgi:hypothetical protein
MVLRIGALDDTRHPRKERHHERRAATGLEDIVPANVAETLKRLPAFADVVNRHPV